MLDRDADRAPRSGHSLFFFLKLSIHLIKLAHLAIGSPTQVALPGVSQVEMRDLLEAPGSVEARGEFIGERLILDKAVRVCGADGLFVKMLGIELAALDACDLRAH